MLMQASCGSKVFILIFHFYFQQPLLLLLKIMLMVVIMIPNSATAHPYRIGGQ